MSLRGHLTDVRPLRTSQAFREIWATSLVTSLAGQIAALAALSQIWDLTESPVWTGAIGLAQGVPTLGLALVGGSLADRYDRRTIVQLSTLAQAVAALGLAAQAASSSTSPWPVLALLSASAGAGALGAPARRTLPVRLLPRDEVLAGLALQNIAFQASMLIGPAVGGLVVAASLPAAYATQVIMLTVAFVAASRLPRLPPERTSGPGLRRGGWSFPWRQPVLRGALLTDLATTTLSMPVAIFPMLNAVRFDGDPRTLGLFLSAIALGGIAAGLVSGVVTRMRRPGLVQLVCAVVWGCALAGCGLSTSLVVALGLLVCAGAADTVGVVARGGLVQLVTPDEMRGRVSAVDHAVGVAGPEIGNMRGGLLAAVVGAPAAIVVGGLGAAVAAVSIGLTHRRTITYVTDTRVGT
ncbi:MFS transporter [Sanguibacter antarcticus]|uniref:Putative MFS family arabinose efflux permease n=1 Tax=Sanguibacter antarcticus TaxID=372484 RepID=A0A2A9E499_9MICO|nr:MFS transporter [Sanguibacter antarcticus]PFG33009.1 putative MFS family arabinose efflux permease [Sanguibacter antarcticus]